FSTTEEGVKGKRAVEWGLVDEVVPRTKLEAAAKARAAERAGRTDRPRDGRGISLAPLERPGRDHGEGARDRPGGGCRRRARGGRRVLAARARARARRPDPPPAHE